MAKRDRKPTGAVMGENLRAFRRQAGLTQEGLARAAGLSRATVAAIELGRYNSVELSSLDALSRALNRAEAAFLARHDNEPPYWSAFIASQWSSVCGPSEDERRCLAQLPDLFWGDREPEAKAVYELIEVRRRHLG